MAIIKQKIADKTLGDDPKTHMPPIVDTLPNADTTLTYTHVNEKPPYKHYLTYTLQSVDKVYGVLGEREKG